MKIIIIACGKKKIFSDNPTCQRTYAKDLYTGNFHKTSQEYALNFADEFCILSAKFGFLFPNDIITEDYDVTFKDKKTNPITIKELKKQIKIFNNYDIIETACGKIYHDIIEDVFEKKIHNHLTGLSGMGFMIQYMKNKIKEEKI